MIGWLFRCIREFKDAGVKIRDLKTIEQDALDKLHASIEKGEIEPDVATTGLESVTLNLRSKGTERVKGNLR